MIDMWYLIDSLVYDLTLELTIKWIFNIIYVYIVVIILIIILLYYITSNNHNHNQRTVVYIYNTATVQSTVADFFFETITIIIFMYVCNHLTMSSKAVIMIVLT